MKVGEDATKVSEMEDTSATETRSSSSSDSSESSFCCGVVEGFYGRPWTTEQRKDLFSKMQAWGMNSYVYAPKDDCKHRAFWRESYTVEEAEHLQSLISLAGACNIDFFYAISPGLDIVYSNPKELSCLKRKLEQVSQLGCKSFALLFDDIEPEMCKQDKEAFQSFAQAQVTITNDIFEHFGQPNFLFCPTQYCTARAVPTVRSSEYLLTLGNKLASGIRIMWTGDKVITKEITAASLQDINEVLKRKVVIWDNIHANDYDQKRVFLGPYSGRSPELILKSTSGVMTNPNCEYGANFVAIHSLAQWQKCTMDGTNPPFTASGAAALKAPHSDIRLEIEPSSNDDFLSGSDYALSSLAPLPPHVYHPKNALINALKDWIPEFSKQKTVWGPMSKPQVGLTAPTPILSVSTGIANTTGAPQTMLVNSLKTSEPIVSHSEAPETPTIDSVSTLASTEETSSSVSINPNIADIKTTSCTEALGTPTDATLMSSSMQPISVPVMNSLVATNKIVVDPNLINETAVSTSSTNHEDDAEDAPMTMTSQKVPSNQTLSSSISATTNSLEALASSVPVGHDIIPGPTYQEPLEPMDTVEETNNSPVMQVEPSEPTGMSKAESSTMLYDEEGGAQICTDPKEVVNTELTIKDLLLLCQLFYLPSEHGQVGLEMLNDFFWLKRNANAVLPPGTPASGTIEERCEWETRAKKFKQVATEIQLLFVKLCSCQNRELVYDLYTYLWDMCSVVQTMEGFVQWLSKGCASPKAQNYVVGQQTWFSGIREAFLSGDHEPWVFRGGLISDLLRLLPLDSGSDLYTYKFPDVPASLLFYVRPFAPKDESAVYDLAAKRFENAMEAPMGLCDADRELIGDQSVGAFLTLCPEYAFVVENSLDASIVAFAVAAPDARIFHTRNTVAWLPEMRLKYQSRFSNHSNVENSEMTPIEAIANTFNTDTASSPPSFVSVSGDDSTHASPWGLLKMHVSSSVQDFSVAKRLTMLVLACLRASGTIRVFCELKKNDIRDRDFYASLGFVPASKSGSAIGEGGDTDTDDKEDLCFLFRNF